MSVKDRVKGINATGRGSVPTNLGDHVRNAPARTPKPEPSIPRQIGQDPATVSRQSGAPPLPYSPATLSSTTQGSQAQRDTNRLSTGREPQASTSRSPSPSPAVTIDTGSLEADVTTWVEEVSGERSAGEPLMEWLKDGQVLCRLANKIQQGICPRINSQSMPFKQMENVTAFIQACRKLGVMEKDVFSTVDLYEGKNPKAVMNCIYNLGAAVRRSAPSFKGPYLGVAQGTNIVDKAREKTMVTQSSGYRADIDNEVRAGVRMGRHM